jgi:adenylate cyclase
VTPANTCPACQRANREGARFCDGCGTRLLLRCASCGAPLRDEARFCDQCGRPLVASPSGAPAATAPGAAGPDRSPAGYTPRHLADKILTTRGALEGERKQVTVLFVDCVGFTALAARLDPEDLHAIMDECFQRALDVVHRYEGTVNQFTGDGVMALFGAPIAHEDHAVRAVAAALAVQHTLGDLGQRLRRERGIEFATRAGLNTGPVVVGRIGDDLRMDYTAQGETVNLAARLQAIAPAGAVLISESTRRLVGGYFVIEDVGPRHLKGLPEPVPAFAVIGQRTRRGRFEIAVERGLTPLTGRKTELAVLRQCLERARTGRGRVVSLVGEAGVGKSRLAWELKRDLGDTPVTYLEGHCLPHAQAVPFHVIVQFLQANFRIETGEPTSAQASKVETGVRRLDPALEWTIPYLKHLLGLPAEDDGGAGLDTAQRKRRLIESVKALALRGARQRPLVLLVEDLQWADPSSREYLDTVVDSLAVAPILLVCTYRAGFVPPWHDRAVHLRVGLEPLAEDDAARMVEALLPADRVQPPVRDVIIERAAGNPYFIEELAAWVQARAITEALAASDVPETIQDLLTARLDRLPPPLKRTLQLASVLGREFSLPVLEAIAEPGHELARDLAELMRLDLVHERALFPGLRYRFAHPLIREVAYQELLLKSRADLHGRAAGAIERLHAGRTDEVLEELADHYARSADRQRAREWQVRAGDRAASLFAYEEAGTYYRRALDTLDPDATADRRVILDRLGEAAFRRGALGESIGQWRAALALAEQDTDRGHAADLHRKLAEALWAAGETEAARAHLERGLIELGPDAENLEAARLYQELGRAHFRVGDHARATDWASRALELGRRLDAPDVVAQAYNTIGVALARADRIEEGAEYVQRSLATARDHKLGSVACRAYTNLAVMYAALDPRRSAEYCREGLALAQRIGDLLQQSWLYCALAGGHCTVTGDYDAGVAALEAAIELDTRLGQRNHLPVPLIIRAQIHQCRGDYGESARYYREALELAEALGEPQLLVPCYEGLATLAVEQGDDAEAEAWLARSRNTQEATGWSADTFRVLPFLC